MYDLNMIGKEDKDESQFGNLGRVHRAICNIYAAIGDGGNVIRVR